MDSDSFSKILLSLASVCIGAFLGILRSRIFASKNPNTLYYVFYGFAGLTIIGSIFYGMYYRNSLNTFGLIVALTAVGASIMLFFYSRRFLTFKNQYKSSQLDPIVNRFTANADRDVIKLFGGDLNFLGSEPSQIDKNVQYMELKSRGFKKVQILCEEPITSTQKIRYGKILHELSGTEFRFYNPEEADLKIRGRIIEINGVNRLLMYKKVVSGIYQAIETDLANSNGALYNNIWDLAWSLATRPSEEMLNSYLDILSGK